VARSSGEPFSGGSGHPHVVAEVTALGEDVRERGGDALGRGHRVEQGAGADPGPGPGVGDAAHHVGDHVAVLAHRDLQTRLRAGGHHLVRRSLNLGLKISHLP
jgi:hypothetical protein